MLNELLKEDNSSLTQEDSNVLYLEQVSNSGITSIQLGMASFSNSY